MRCHLPVRVYPEDRPRVIQTLTKDLSLGGLRCVTPTKPAEVTVTVEIDLGRHQSIRLKAKPVWSQAIPGSEQFYLGLAFQHLPEIARQRLSRCIGDVSHQDPQASSLAFSH